MTGPTCPRCAYDLSGPVATWTDQCPIAGRCPECGLDFAWREILHPDFAGPAWSFEHGTRRLAARYLGTLARCLHPARAWRGLTLATSIHPRRLMLFTVLTLVLMQLAAAVATLAPRLMAPPLARLVVRQVPRTLVWPYGEGRFHSLLDGMPFGTPLLLITAGLTVFMPLGLLLLGETLARHSVRARHLLRGAAYSVPLAAVWVAATTLLRHGLWHSPGYFIVDALSRLGASMPLLGGAYAVLLALWWRSFLGGYLRLASPGLIAAVMIVLAYLATITSLLLLTIATRSI